MDQRETDGQFSASAGVPVHRRRPGYRVALLDVADGSTPADRSSPRYTYIRERPGVALDIYLSAPCGRSLGCYGFDRASGSSKHHKHPAVSVFQPFME